MNCAECEKLIFIYKELDATDRKKVDEHIASCNACAALLLDVQRSQNLFQVAMKSVPEKLENVNPFLTSKIISAIESKHFRSESIIERFVPIVRFAFARYAMAIASLALLIVFIMELNPMNQAEKAVTYYKRTQITKTVQLNSAAFRDKLRNSLKENSRDLAGASSLSKCLSECANSSDESCKDCSNLLNKIKNEGI